MNQYKSVFLSDIHLGFSGCQSDKLLNFLNNTKCEKLFLVGDIVDFWSMNDKFFWPKEHQEVLDAFLKAQENGTEVFLITGNHDDPMRAEDEFEELTKRSDEYKRICNSLKKFKISDKFEYKTHAHGNLLVIHGDQYDVVTSNIKWLSKFGGFLYDLLIKINRPMSKALKTFAKSTVNKASSFQKNVKKDCLKKPYDGLLCGHIHAPEIKRFPEYLYLNTGDWIESCTAITESFDGTLELATFRNSRKEILAQA